MAVEALQRERKTQVPLLEVEEYTALLGWYHAYIEPVTHCIPDNMGLNELRRIYAAMNNRDVRSEMFSGLAQAVSGLEAAAARRGLI